MTEPNEPNEPNSTTPIQAAARRAEAAALAGDREGFLAECLTVNQLTGIGTAEPVTLSPAERVACLDAGAASLASDIATSVIRASRALRLIHKPMSAAALLGGAVSEPMLSRVVALRDEHAKVREGLSHANSAAEFIGLHSEERPLDLTGQAAALEEARFLLHSLPEKPGSVQVMVIGDEDQVSAALLDEFPNLHITRVTATKSGVGRAKALAVEYLDRVAWFVPTNHYDLPKRPGGYDLAVVLNVLHKHPRPQSFIAFVHEQCGLGVYTVPEALKHADEQVLDEPRFLVLNGFCRESLAQAFDNVGLAGDFVCLPEGYVLGVVGAEKQ
jgi:hypothetical protein